MVVSFILALLGFLVALASEITGKIHDCRMAEIYDLPQPQNRSWSHLIMRPIGVFMIILFVCEVVFP